MGFSSCSVTIWVLVSYKLSNYGFSQREFNLNLEVAVKELSHLFLMHFEEIQNELYCALIQLYKEGNVLPHFPDTETEVHTHTVDKCQSQGSNSVPLTQDQNCIDFKYSGKKYIP